MCSWKTELKSVTSKKSYLKKIHYGFKRISYIRTYIFTHCFTKERSFCNPSNCYVIHEYNKKKKKELAHMYCLTFIFKITKNIVQVTDPFTILTKTSTVTRTLKYFMILLQRVK